MQSRRPLLGTPGCWQALTTLAGTASPVCPLTPARAGPSPLWQEAVTPEKAAVGIKVLLRAPVSFRQGKSQPPQ